MTVPSNIITHNRHTVCKTTYRPTVTDTVSYTLAYSGTEPGSNLGRVVLNPSPCEYHIYTDVDSLAYETVREVQPNIHFTRDLFRTWKIIVEYVASAEQHADILTKALSRADFQYHRKRLMNLSE